MCPTKLLVGFSLVAALTISTSTFAQTERKPTAGEAAPVRAETVPESKSTIPKNPIKQPPRPTGVRSAMPLSVQECKDLGGEVKTATGVCLSQYVCITTDERGNEHGVCLSKK
jgi:hypothetical protein